MSLLAYLLGFLAAGSNAAANVLQRAANREEDNQDVEFSFQLIRNLLHQPLWFAGIAAMTASFFLQATGLGLGTLAGVEPLLVLELPITMVASRFFLDEGIDRRAWMAIAAMTAATVALIAFLGPSGGHSSGIAWWTWLIAVGASAGLVAVCYGLGVHWSDETKRSAILGIGTGACYGFSASLVKGMTSRFADGGITGMLTSWQLYGAVFVGIFAVWMHQNAVSAARLVVAQPGVTLVDPYMSIAWGIAVYGESVRGGAWTVGAVVAALVLTGSAVVLSQSQSTEEEEAGGSADGDGDDGGGGRDDTPRDGRDGGDGDQAHRGRPGDGPAGARPVPAAERG